MPRWLKPTGLVVTLFLIAFIAVRCQEAHAETLMEVAPASSFVGGDHYQGAGLSFAERLGGKYDLGALLLSEQTCECSRGDQKGNLAAFAQRVVTWRALELGLGVAYFQNQGAMFSANTAFALHWGVNYKRFSLRHRHFSTGGASDRNGGLDMILIGYTFP